MCFFAKIILILTTTKKLKKSFKTPLTFVLCHRLKSFVLLSASLNFTPVKKNKFWRIFFLKTKYIYDPELYLVFPLMQQARAKKLGK